MLFVFFLMIRRPPRSTQSRSSAASDVYKRQLWTQKRWGYFGTLALSAATIAFDVWAIVTVQWSAAMGIVLPALFIAYLLLIRKDFDGEGAN